MYCWQVMELKATNSWLSCNLFVPLSEYIVQDISDSTVKVTHISCMKSKRVRKGTKGKKKRVFPGRGAYLRMDWTRLYGNPRTLTRQTARLVQYPRLTISCEVQLSSRNAKFLEFPQPGTHNSLSSPKISTHCCYHKGPKGTRLTKLRFGIWWALFFFIIL